MATVTEQKRAVQATAVIEPFAPEPTAKFIDDMQTLRTRAGAIPLPIPIPIPLPFVFGSRFLIWKQDPTVLELGRRLVYIEGLVHNGPRDARVITTLPGTTPVVRNVNGDFVFTVADSPEADCAHTYAVVRHTLTMFERLRDGTPIPWAWNTGANIDPLETFPRAGVTANAFYSRSQKALKFFFFTPTGSTTQVFTCRSLDIAAHETGHAILDGLKPGWLAVGNPPQTGALHESFGDLAALFLAIAQLDQAEAFVAITKANLHAKNFLAALAEQFGAALGMPIGLRNADNDLKLSQVSNQVHALSQVFTGGIYDVLADIYAFERNRQRKTKDPALILVEVGQHLAKLWLTGIVKAPNTGATFADVVNAMLTQSHAQGDPAIYRTFIRNRFTLREVVVSPTPLTAMRRGDFDYTNPDYAEGGDVLKLAPMANDHPSLVAEQDRSDCCGTMQLPEYFRPEKQLRKELEELQNPGVTLDPDRIPKAEVEELEKAFA